MLERREKREYLKKKIYNENTLNLTTSLEISIFFKLKIYLKKLYNFLTIL